MEQKFIAQDFQRVLFSIYNKRGHHPIIPNFSGISRWEADLFSISKAGYMYEFEIKLSRSDYHRDFKKVSKHKMFESGRGCTSNTKSGLKIKSPNYFTFVCPEGMISVDEVPQYAGLLYVCNTDKYSFRNNDVKQIRRLRSNVEIKEVKKPKRIHDSRADINIYKKISQVLSGRFMYGNKFYDYSKENGYFG